MEQAVKAMEAPDRFGFMENKTDAGRRVRTSSAFWRTAQNVAKQLLKLPESEEYWYQKIAWANLFPVAPSDGGNPSAALIEAQRPIAKEILNATIKYYKPTHILFETGWDYWLNYKGFSMLDGFYEDKRLPDESGIVIKKGHIETAKVVIASRPENKIAIIPTELTKERFYAETVIKAFESLE